MRPAESLHHFDVKDIGLDIRDDTPLEFDPGGELSEADWRKMDDNLKKARDTNLSDFVYVASRMATIDSDRMAKRISDDDREMMMRYAERHGAEIARQGWEAISARVHALSHAAIFEPEKIRAMFQPGVWAIIEGKLPNLSPDSSRSRHLLFAMAEIDPERARSMFTEDDWKRAESRLGRVLSYYDTHDICTDTYQVSVLATIDPERVRTLITPANWTIWRDVLEVFRGNPGNRFIDLTASLTRLSRALSQKPQAKENTVPLPIVKVY